MYKWLKIIVLESERSSSPKPVWQLGFISYIIGIPTVPEP